MRAVAVSEATFSEKKTTKYEICLDTIIMLIKENYHKSSCTFGTLL
jgi:hypothetical protein